MSRDILAVSFAPRDTHEAQVQFALERGVPALIGVLASIRLPYPSRAFDMAHCSRCLIPWGQNGTFNLLYFKYPLSVDVKFLYTLNQLQIWYVCDFKVKYFNDVSVFNWLAI